MKIFKKLQLGTLVVLFIVGLAGCGNVTEEDQLKGRSVSYVGTLKTLGAVLIEGKADHILESESGEVYYVYSSFIDLDREKYDNARVQISGEVTHVTDSGKEVIAIESIIPLTEDIVFRDTISEVEKKYQNVDLGIKIEHLKGWSTDENPPNNVKFVKEKAELIVTRYANPESLTVFEWVDASDTTTPSLLGPDQLKSYVVEMPGSAQYIVSRTNNYIYDITYNYPTSDPDLGNQLKTIVNSFQFVPIKDGAQEPAASPPGSTDYSTQIAYFNEHINELNPDYGGSSNYDITRFEFVTLPEESRDLAYVIYQDKNDEYRTLFTYDTVNGKVENIATLAHFKPGDVTDWELMDGIDRAKGNKKIVIGNEDNGGAAVEVAEGYRLFESGPFDFTVQYPSNWYVQGQGGKYLFNDAPLNGSYLVKIQIVDKEAMQYAQDLPYNFERLDDRTVIAYSDDPDSEGVYMIMKRDEESAYEIWGHKDYESIVKEMVGSIVD